MISMSGGNQLKTPQGEIGWIGPPLIPQSERGVLSQFEISAPWVESGPLVIGRTDKCDAQIVSNLTVRRQLKLF